MRTTIKLVTCKQCKDLVFIKCGDLCDDCFALPKYTRAAITGSKVTVAWPVSSYYSNYGGNPVMMFRPGMTAVIGGIAPKVRVIGQKPENDTKVYFVYADYQCPETNRLERVGINFCNLVFVKE